MVAKQSRNRARFIALLALGLAVFQLTAAPVVGQAPAPSAQSAPAQQPPALRVAVAMVQINVIVQDKQGNPVMDLARDDFAVYDQKKPQKVEYFSIEAARPLGAFVPSALAPDAYSNRLDVKTGVPTSVTVILLDTLNTHYEDVPFAREQVKKFLSQIQPQDRVALYGLGTSLRVLHDFTSDAVPLLRALNLYQTGPSAQLQGSQPAEFVSAGPDVPATFDQMMRESRERQANFNVLLRAQWTTLALEAIANRLAQLPGRKNLIWVTSSFPYSINIDRVPETSGDILEKRTFDEQIQRAVRALNQANLAVYPVDVRGLIAPRLIRPEQFHGTAVGPTLTARLPDEAISAGPARPGLDTFNVLAERTGGRPAYNENEIFAAIRRAIDDSRVTYVLGFYPRQGQLDAKFHEIKVDVRRPNLRVSHRKGYFALPEQKLDPEQRRAFLREAAAGPLDATGLGLTVHAVPVNTSGTREAKLSLRIERNEVNFEQKEGFLVGSIDVIFAARNAEGEILGVQAQGYDLRLPQQIYEMLGKTGLVVVRRLAVPDKAAEIRVVVRDNGAGSIGSVSIPVSKLFPRAGS